jgi:hypothetical protein
VCTGGSDGSTGCDSNTDWQVLPGCTKVIGYLKISDCRNGAGNVCRLGLNLENLAGLTTVEGTLDISQHRGTNLRSLDGLSQLTSVTGQLIVENNPGIQSFDGLKQLKTVGSSISM